MENFEPCIVECPHCKELMYIEELNCSIFRHAIMKDTFVQVDPHLPKEGCEQLLKEDKVFGCCKPFIVLSKDNVVITKVCDYI